MPSQIAQLSNPPFKPFFFLFLIKHPPYPILQRRPPRKRAHTLPVNPCVLQTRSLPRAHTSIHTFTVNMKRSTMSRCATTRSVHWTLFAQCPMVMLLVLFHINVTSSAEAPPPPDHLGEILLIFKDSLNEGGGDALKSWVKNTAPCGTSIDGKAKEGNWAGVLCDNKGKLWGLQLDKMGLSGDINVEALAELPDLISISITENNFEGTLPDWRRLKTLKTLYLSKNKFSGEIPGDSFEGMKALKKLEMADNQFSGEIPESLARLKRLAVLTLNGNKFTGEIPDFEETKLKVFNVSGNNLEGEIPQKFKDSNPTNFEGNHDLCGAPLEPCSKAKAAHIAMIVVMCITAVMAICAAIFFLIIRRRNKNPEYSSTNIESPPATSTHNASSLPFREPDPDRASHASTSDHSATAAHKKGDHALKLSFVRDDRQSFDMHDLLKASAEVMGSGSSFGLSYKAALVSGAEMVVKRYKQMNVVGKEEFQEHVRRLGRLDHPNLLPLVAYYYKKEEKLLITDNVIKGSLAAHLHGNQTKDQPSLDWPKRLKIVKGVAQGLKYLYKELPSITTPHGHLKSSNVLLNESYEPLITDYALMPIINPEHAQTLMVAYKSPEYVATKQITKKTDVWSLGVLILEILTGKQPGKGSEEDLASWVNSVPEEEWLTQVFDKEMGAASKNHTGEMLKLLKVGLECCEVDLEKRCSLKEAVERIDELKEVGDSGEVDVTKLLL